MTGSLNNLLRLSFKSHDQYTDFINRNRLMFEQIWFWHQSIGNQEGPIRLSGVCDLCSCQTSFETETAANPPGSAFTFQGNWWIGFRCGCGTHALDRAVYRALLDTGQITDRIYHVGHFSPVMSWLTERGARNVLSSQFEIGRRPGEIENGIRYEDLTELSLPDRDVDCIIVCEILEHIFDYEKALREMARVLRPGGRALLTFPWLGGDYYEHLQRAEVRSDGQIHHFLEPEYHGDPASSDGVLSFRSYGWKILDEIRASGFSDATARFLFGPLHGQMTLLYPVIVARV